MSKTWTRRGGLELGPGQSWSWQRVVRNSGTCSLDVDPWGEDGRLGWGEGDVRLAAAVTSIRAQEGPRIALQLQQP